MNTYKTIRAAAIAGLRAAVPLTRKTNHEYGSFILRKGKRFAPLPPETSQETEALDIGKIIKKIIGFNAEDARAFEPVIHALQKKGVVSSYHTHPIGDDPSVTPFMKYFSMQDMSSMGKTGTHSIYIAESSNGNVREGTPQLPLMYPTYDLMNPATLGPVVGHVKV